MRQSCLLQAGYGVIFLTRTGTLQPYSGGLSEGELHNRILDLLLPDSKARPQRTPFRAVSLQTTSHRAGRCDVGLPDVSEACHQMRRNVALS